jgi:hypothetical protein
MKNDVPQSRTRSFDRLTRRLFAWAAGVALIAGSVGVVALAGDDPLAGAVVQVTVDGRTRQYRLQPADPAPTSLPVTQPSPTSQPVPPMTPVPPTTPAEAGHVSLPAQLNPAGRIQFLPVQGGTPTTIHASAVNLIAEGSLPNLYQFEWSVRGPDGKPVGTPRRGFNTAYCLDEPGEYTLTLDVTDPSGSTKRIDTTARVAPLDRQPWYIAAGGDPSSMGRDPNRPTPIGRIMAGVRGDRATILFRRGDTFDLPNTLKIDGTRIVLGAYGDPNLPPPVLRWTGPIAGNPYILELAPNCREVTIQDIAFDSTVVDAGAPREGMPSAIRPDGEVITVRRCAFLNVRHGINANQDPEGLLVEGCVVPRVDCLRDYFVWADGKDLVIADNFVANSMREHVLRASGVERIAVVNNDFANRDRRDKGDKYDTSKGAIVIQRGDWAYVAGNFVRFGPIGVGPLGEKDGLKHPDARFNVAVFENNRVHTAFYINHGANKVTIRNNLIRQADTRAINVQGWNGDYQRGTSDAFVLNNTGLRKDEKGGFIRLESRVDGITLSNNAYIAPDLAPGSHGTAAVFVAGDDLSSFRAIENNLWPRAKPDNYADGGVNYVWAKGTDRRGYKKPADWNALPPVKNDRFDDLPLEGYTLPPGVGCDESKLPPAWPDRSEK